MTLLEALRTVHALADASKLTHAELADELVDVAGDFPFTSAEVDRQQQALILVDDLIRNHAELIDSFGVIPPTNPQEESHIEQEAPVEAGADSEPDVTLYFAECETTTAIAVRHYDIGADPQDGALMLSSDRLDPRNDLWNHSPDGFSWGYGGSGPAQLALAILADHLQDDALAVRLHQPFKWAIIANMPKEDDFGINSEQIDEWLATHRREGDLTT